MLISKDDLSPKMLAKLEEVESQADDWSQSLYTLEVDFDDGSKMTFNWAKYIVMPEDDIFIIVTEHCGTYAIKRRSVNCLRKVPRGRSNDVVFATSAYNG